MLCVTLPLLQSAVAFGQLSDIDAGSERISDRQHERSAQGRSEVSPRRGSHEEEAERLIRRGIEARRQGRDDDAVSFFEQALQFHYTPRASAQLGLGCQAVGRWACADRYLTQALEASTDPWVERNRRHLERALGIVQANLGTMLISGGVDGARVLVDGQELARLPMTEPSVVGIGSHVLEVVAEGYYRVSRPIQIEAGQLRREAVVLRPREIARAPSSIQALDRGMPVASVSRARNLSNSAEARSLRMRRIGWALLGAGFATGVGAGIAFAVRQNAARDWNSSDCLIGGRTRADNCRSDRDRADSAELAAQVLLGMGAGLAATSVVLLLIPDSGPRERRAAKVSCGTFADFGMSCAMQF
ncbi:MAG: PEGA domain-containing protein [Myxococcota bacterium]